jgi:hypothetical protein
MRHTLQLDLSAMRHTLQLDILHRSLPAGVFDLDNDPEERHELSQQKPEILSQLLTLYKNATSVWVPGDPVCQDCTADKFCSALTTRRGWMGPFSELPAA